MGGQGTGSIATSAAQLSTNALITLDTVNEYLGFKTGDNTARDNFLIRKINTMSALAEQYMNRTLSVQTYTDNFQGNNRQYLMLRNYPLVSVTSVTFFGNVLDASQYSVDDYCLSRGMIFKETGWTANDFLIGIGNDPMPGTKVIQVTYTAGYVTIPYDIQDAVTDLVVLKFKESTYGENRLGIEAEKEGGISYTYSKKDTAIPSEISSIFDRYAVKRV